MITRNARPNPIDVPDRCGRNPTGTASSANNAADIGTASLKCTWTRYRAALAPLRCRTEIYWRSSLILISDGSRWGTAICSRSEEHTSELQSRLHLVCRLLLEKKKKKRVNQ